MKLLARAIAMVGLAFVLLAERMDDDSLDEAMQQMKGWGMGPK